MENNVNINLGGFFSTILQLGFIFLKLTGHITWSWWCVLIPTWFFLGIFIFGIIMIILATIFKGG